MDEDLDLSLQALGSSSYHVEDGPSKLTGTSHSTPLGPSEPREGPKQQRANEDQPGSGGLTPKCHRLVASR
jgi:hypothetical protein